MTLYILLFQHQKRILITNIVIIISSILLIVNVSLLQAKSTNNNIDDIISISTDGNITLHDTLLTLPTNSLLIKFAILPKNSPIGETHAIISNKRSLWIFFLYE